MSSTEHQPFGVVIVGGGVAGLEAALALRDMAGDRAAITMVAPDADFVYRPLRVKEPFAEPEAHHYPLDEIARDIGLELKQDRLQWLDAARRVVHTAAGDELSYDALLLAPGARPYRRFRHAVTLDDRRLDEQLHGLIQDVEGGYAHKLAFIAPSRMAWPLPLYELALMMARRACDMNEDISVTIVTSEESPLAVFGGAVSAAVQRVLGDNKILFVGSTRCETSQPGKVTLHPGGRSLSVDRVVALPELFGPSTPGVPKDEGHGFISVDAHGRVRGVDRVFAAGDATAFPVKHGGVAAQQADVAAEAIAILTGASVQQHKFHPVIHGMLLGGDHPLYLSAHITGGHGSSSQVSEEPTWFPGTKIAAKYLAPYLDARDRVAVR